MKAVVVTDDGLSHFARGIRCRVLPAPKIPALPVIQFLAKCAVIEVHVARLKYSCMTGGRFEMRHGCQIDWLSCIYE